MLIIYYNRSRLKMRLVGASFLDSGQKVIKRQHEKPKFLTKFSENLLSLS